MILAITFRGSKNRPRSPKPDALGFNVRREGGRIIAPALTVTRLSRAKTVTGTLFSDAGTERIKLSWPQFKPGVHTEVTLETAS